MKSILAALLVMSNVFAISAFVIQPKVNVRSPLAMAIMTDAPAPVSPPMTPSSLIVSSNSLQSSSFQQQPASFNQYFEASSSSSSSTLVSVQEYKKPTAEEIAAKKRNFAFWFWGGGFVAPFLATFYYFGLKFWER